MRYAIYFSKEADHPLTRAAAGWLGRDAFGEDVPAAPGREELVADPARYGFHGTLKAPFHLRGGIDSASLFDAFDEFCAETPAFEIPEIVIGQLGPFFALVPGAKAMRASMHLPMPVSAPSSLSARPQALPISHGGNPTPSPSVSNNISSNGVILTCSRNSDFT